MADCDKEKVWKTNCSKNLASCMGPLQQEEGGWDQLLQEQGSLQQEEGGWDQLQQEHGER